MTDISPAASAPSSSGQQQQQRCVVVSNVSPQVGPDILAQFFGQVGPVAATRTLGYDPVADAKHFLCVFASSAHVAAALLLTGTPLLGKAIRVTPGDTLPSSSFPHSHSPVSPLSATPTPTTVAFEAMKPSLLPAPSPQHQHQMQMPATATAAAGKVVVLTPPTAATTAGTAAAPLIPIQITPPPSLPLAQQQQQQQQHQQMLTPESAAAMISASARFDAPNAAHSTQKAEEVQRTVYVGNVPAGVSCDQLADLFAGAAGPVGFCRIAGDDAHPARFAFVEFQTAQGAAAALALSGRATIHGRQLRVSPSKTPIVRPAQKVADVRRQRAEQERLMRAVAAINRKLTSPPPQTAATSTTEAAAKPPPPMMTTTTTTSADGAHVDKEKDDKKKSHHHHHHHHHHRSSSRSHHHHHHHHSKKRRSRSRDDGRQEQQPPAEKRAKVESTAASVATTDGAGVGEKKVKV